MMDEHDILTPLDLQQKQFRVKMRGYHRPEVDSYLDRVAATLQSLMQENESLKDELQRRQEELAEFKKREQLLKDTLINAQKVIEMMKANAQKEGENIIHESEVKAEKILQETFNRQARIKNEITELQKVKANLVEDLKGMLRQYQNLLEAAVPPPEAAESA